MSDENSKVKITFMPSNKTIEVDLKDVPNKGVGKPGSLLDYAIANGIEINHVCDGCVACSTCHVIIDEGFENTDPIVGDEADQLAVTAGRKPTSRLACQCVLKGNKDMKVTLIDMLAVGAMAIN